MGEGKVKIFIKSESGLGLKKLLHSFNFATNAIKNFRKTMVFHNTKKANC